MKACKIPYCKEIPNDWQEIPNRYLFAYHSVKVGEHWRDYQLLSLTTSGIKEKDINAGGGKVPDSYDKYQTVEPGDMIFCLFDLDVSAVFSGLSNHYGMITSAYEVVKTNRNILDQGFSDYWFQYVFSNRYYKMYSKNIRFTITSEMFKAINTPVPPLAIQKKIACFLNEKTAKIDKLIEIENQQIEKLKEYKQAVITEAVTKGLDKSAPMKDSGIEWIGEMPKNWNKIKVVNLFDEIGSGTTPKGERYYSDGTYNWIQSGDINGGNMYSCSKRVNNLALNDFSALKIYRAPYLIIAMYGGSVGHLSISHIDACCNQACCVMKSPKCNFDFAVFTFMAVKNYLLKSAIGGGQPNISQTIIKQLWFCSPSRKEQEQIVQHLKKECLVIDSLISIKQKKIDMLNEYKKSLIYEYVTGKKEVV